jgi:hypothetical protein
MNLWNSWVTYALGTDVLVILVAPVLWLCRKVGLL